MKSEKYLEKRLHAEELFHNKKYMSEDNALPSHYKLQPTVFIYEYMKEMIGDISNKKVLEYGCGDGWITIDLAKKAKTLDTFDISNTAIQRTQQELAKRRLDDRCRIRKMSAEKLDYYDKSFDIVFGFAILHHLDLKKAIAELYRVMKPGGRAIFAEPLGTNPILNMYRKATPQYRTKDEEPLNINNFGMMLDKFSAFKHKEYYLTSLLPLSISNMKALFNLSARMFTVTRKIDQYLLKISMLKRFAWYSIMIITK